MRTIVLDCGLIEALKWGCPCYTFQESNVVLIHVFKEYCALLFFKGALLNDADGILRFTEILARIDAHQRAGRTVFLT